MLLCVLCIYQRVALLGIALAALLVLFAPTCCFLRGMGLVLWSYSSSKGLLAAWEQTQRYLYPERFTFCPFRVNFPEWLPLDNWFPAVFKAYAACGSSGGSLLGMSLPQWMIFLFVVFLSAGILGLIAQIAGWTLYAQHLRLKK